MRNTAKQIARKMAILACIAVLGGFFAATLLRFAPGYSVDERELDPRLSAASREAIRQERQLSSGLASYYGNYLLRVIHGDFGRSQWLDQPVAGLLKERLPVTVKSVGFGLGICWISALTMALANVLWRKFFLDIAGTIASGILIALPTGVIGVLAVYLRAPVGVAIAVVVFPKIFRYTRNLLEDAYQQSYVIAARARGVTESRIVFGHVLPLVSAPIVSLLGVSMSLAFGAAVPVEAFCDSPGLGQLAWQAALNRDLPLLVGVTLVLVVLTTGFHALASLRQEAPSERA